MTQGDDPDEQALMALVLTGLRRPLDPGEARRLERLIDTVADGRVIADTVVEQWMLAGILDPSALDPGVHAGGERAEPVIEAIPAPAATRRRFLWLGSAAAAAGVAGLVGWQAMRPTATDAGQMLAADGTGPSRSRLSDGSSVLLSRDARVMAAIGPDERRIRHLSGEAFYHVARDRTRPFVVEVGGYTLTALGTGFNVDPVEDGVCVDLLEGRLRIARNDGAGRALILFAGQRFVGGAEVRVTAADPDAVAWGDGRLVFDDAALADVARRLGHHSDVALIFDDPAMAALRFSGVMEIDAPRSWRIGLEAALPVHVTQQRDGLHVAPAG